MIITLHDQTILKSKSRRGHVHASMQYCSVWTVKNFERIPSQDKGNMTVQSELRHMLQHV